MDSLNKNMTVMIQQSALSIAKQTKKQKNPTISSPTRALMKKRREMIENKTPRDHIEQPRARRGPRAGSGPRPYFVRPARCS